ncbi:hypothetical protein EB796_025214 [Bugula neritina]|uniref:Carboxypeptidase activation peptide domain-containing protein n=1 Tax=Bugula neritina TaxID=10212 RepID=A0A7J7IRF7_BUGNE|nr:hypothetical protein EB796_025214 [Bugula neritina]
MVPVSDQQVQILKKLEEDYPMLDFWTEPAKNRNVDVNVPPGVSDYFRNVLANAGLRSEVIHQDLQK